MSTCFLFGIVCFSFLIKERKKKKTISSFAWLLSFLYVVYSWRCQSVLCWNSLNKVSLSFSFSKEKESVIFNKRRKTYSLFGRSFQRFNKLKRSFPFGSFITFSSFFFKKRKELYWKKQRKSLLVWYWKEKLFLWNGFSFLFF